MAPAVGPDVTNAAPGGRLTGCSIRAAGSARTDAAFDPSGDATTLAAVDEAARAIAGVADLEIVLQLIVDRVRDLVGASYAALGIAGQGGRMERFITSGMTQDQRHAIGPLPEGRGLLGLIIHAARSYRIPSIADHPDSSGFPPNHPPMTSFLGVRSLRGIPDRQLLPDGQGRGDRVFARRPASRRALRPARRDRHRQRPSPRSGAPPGSHRGAGSDRRDLHDGIIQSLYAVGLSLEEALDQVPRRPMKRPTGSTRPSNRSTSRSATSGTSSSAFGRSRSTAASSSPGSRALAEELRLGGLSMSGSTSIRSPTRGSPRRRARRSSTLLARR